RAAKGNDSAVLRRIEQRSGVRDFDFGVHRSHSELDRNTNRKPVADFYQAAPGGETFRGNIQAINAKRKLGGGELAVGADRELLLKLIGFAEELARGGDALSLWVAYFDLQFAAFALGLSGESGHQEKEYCERHRASDRAADFLANLHALPT